MYRSAIGRPRVLLVVSHPAVGGGIETLLRLERRYEVRRATKLTEALRVCPSWPADLAHVDALIDPPEYRVALGVPMRVLAGGEAGYDATARNPDDQRAGLSNAAVA